MQAILEYELYSSAECTGPLNGLFVRTASREIVSNRARHTLNQCAQATQLLKLRFRILRLFFVFLCHLVHLIHFNTS